MAETGCLVIGLQGDEVSITGDIGRITGNRLAMMYLRRNTKHEVIGEDSILIKEVKSLDSVMPHIKALAKYAQCEIRLSDEANNELQDYGERERRFAEFSQKAYDIRENRPVIAEFKEFEESLIEHMPNRRLYQLQMLSAYHMAFAQNACNFSVPGAGKTSVVYGAYAYLHSLPPEHPKYVDRLLIIGPLSSFGPWEGEYQECFGRPVRSVRLVGGMSRDDKSIYLHGRDTAELTLTSYQSVVSVKDALKFFIARNKVMVVLDEAHKVKNTQGAITAVSTLELASHAVSRIVLTGTPAPNGYEDLYNLFRFIWPDRNVISYSLSQLKNMSHTQDDARIPDMIRRISPFFIRVRKSDLGIPPAQYKEIRVPMSDSQRAIYDVIERRTMQSLADGQESPYIQRVRQARLVRLLQAATNPGLLTLPMISWDDNGEPLVESDEDKAFIREIRAFIKDELPNKFHAAADIVEKIINSGGKVVIWASFIKNIERMKVCLASRGINTRELYGATPVEGDDNSAELENRTREAIVREFNSPHSSFNVIIANPFAVAESISLHKGCHNAIYLERSFNAAHFIQSKDRIHRYGLAPDTVTTYYYLISENSIDETVNDRLGLKERRLNEIMESMPIPLFDNVLESGGLDDVKAILRDYERRAKAI